MKCGRGEDRSILGWKPTIDYAAVTRFRNYSNGSRRAPASIPAKGECIMYTVYRLLPDKWRREMIGKLSAGRSRRTPPLLWQLIDLEAGSHLGNYLPA